MTAFSDRWDGKRLFDALDQSVRQYGDREAYVFEDGRLTYRAVGDASIAVARALLAAGVRPGQRIAIVLAGYSYWPALYFGAARVGAVIVPVNSRFKLDELEYVLRASEARVLLHYGTDSRERVYGSAFLDFAAHPEHLRALCPTAETVVDLAAADGDRSSLATFLTPGRAIGDDVLAAAEQCVEAGDVALIQFTSGSTAQPKGAQLSHTGMLRGAQYNGDRLHLAPADRFFSAQPFYHSGGSVQVMLTPFTSGATVVVQRYFDAEAALATMERERCTCLLGHQPHWIEYLNSPTRATRKLVLQKAYILATPEVNRQAGEAFGIPLISPYGLTETSLGGTGCDIGDPADWRLTTIGKPHPGMELQIRDSETDAVVGAGETGEIMLRGWGIMLGYLNDPVRTAAVIGTDGWFRTGDAGVIDENGNLALRNRIKDMIRVGGENVAAVEVEDLLLRHPAVKQAVVVSKKDRRLGEVCLAFVEPKEGTSTYADELIAYCRERVASFKVPREIRFVDTWPMLGSGKINKLALRERAETEA
jgi:acyl-CoA synthetase (AMP-forming)/AMP-acid ligase II